MHFPRRLTSLALVLAGSFAAPASTDFPASIAVAPDVYNGLAIERIDPSAAERRFAEAQAAAEKGNSDRAFANAVSAVRLDPNHELARRVLGFELVEGQWRTPYEARQHRRGFVWDARYGWVRAEDVPRYEGGERRDGRRWVTRQQDAEAHAAIEDGWQVRTDHFVVTTNHSLETGARFAAELEGLFQVWRQLFAAYWLPDREVRALFAGERDARKTRRPMRVFYHRDKPGYVEHLRRRQPRIAETLGIYFDDRREAHFFHSDVPEDAAQLRATLYHEAAHQLFAENGPGRVGAGRDANFWLIEGVACFFELLHREESTGVYTLGDPVPGRLVSAVARGPVMSLADLARLGQSDLQRLENLPAVYAQATGVVTMLQLGGSEADRDALVAALRAVYAGKDDAETLAREAGRSYGELDRRYRAFLANLPL